MMDETALSTKDGVPKKTYKENYEVITTLAASARHQAIIQELQKHAKRKMLSENLNKPQQTISDEQLYKITARIIRTIYVETKLNIPVSSHSALITLQEANEINLGFHHHDKKVPKKWSISLVTQCMMRL